jgi:hypothetical protein
LFTSGNSIQKLDLRTKEIKTLFTSDNERDITSSYMDEKESIYYTVRDKYGVFNLAPKTGKITHFNKDLKVSYKILEKNEKLWTTHNLGFMAKQTGDLTFVNQLIEDSTSLKLPRTDSYDIEFLSDSEIALATLTHGFYIYNIKDKTITQYDGKNASVGELSNAHIINIHKGKSSKLIYVATSADLNIWDRASDTFSYINEGDGLKGKIESMYEDSNQNLWVQTTEGLHHIKDQQVIARYGEKYNLNSGPTHGNHSMTEDDEGMIYVSTAYALFRFDPKKLQHVGEPNDVIIKDLYLKREKVKPALEGVLEASILYDPQIVLDYHNRDIGFSYVSPFERESELDYYYRLIGYDITWRNNKVERQVHFTNLDQGKYTFQVKSKSADGKWTANVTSTPFEIKPPWYATWWAYCLFAISLSSMLYSIFRYRIRQITKYQKLRTKISADLHDDVGSLLSALAMQSDFLGLDAPPEKASKFNKFSALSREAMIRMRDTVWAIDSRKDNMESLIDRMTDYIFEIYEDYPTKVIFDNESSNLTSTLAPDIRQNIYLIFKEALNNSLKYSNGNQVWVSLSQVGKNILLSVKDNGTAAKIKTSGNGISNMKMRAKKIDAKLEIINIDGFEVRLLVEKK